MIKSVTDPVTVANDLRPVLLKLARHLRRELHHLDVSAGQLSILAEIAKSPGVGIRGLSESEGVSAARMSKAVEGLVALELAERREGSDRRHDEPDAPAELERLDEAAKLLAKLLEPGE